jgi:uncharacterized protein (DUF2236 family)
MTRYLPPNSVARRLSNEPACGLLAGRALVLQLAHPAVAAGVEEHSDFKSHPLKRLLGTLTAMYSITNGPHDLAQGMGERVRHIHSFVTGAGYRANDPANLLWVHATLVDSVLLANTLFVRPLSVDLEQAFYQEMKKVALPFGLAEEDQPKDLQEFHSYFDSTVRRLRLTETSRELIGFVLSPELPGGLHRPLGPALSLMRLITVATIPEPIRVQAGLRWDSHNAAAFRSVQVLVKAAMRAQPYAARSAPVRLGAAALVRRAEHQVERFQAGRSAAGAGRAS